MWNDRMFGVVVGVIAMFVASSSAASAAPAGGRVVILKKAPKSIASKSTQKFHIQRGVDGKLHVRKGPEHKSYSKVQITVRRVPPPPFKPITTLKVKAPAPQPTLVVPAAAKRDGLR